LGGLDTLEILLARAQLLSQIPHKVLSSR